MDFHAEIKYIYDDNYRWLIFVEAKHIASVTLLISLIALFNDKDSLMYFDETIIRYIVMAFWGISLLISLSSFLPWLNKSKFLLKKCKKQNRKVTVNAFFYSSIFNMAMENSDIGFLNKYYDYLFENYCAGDKTLIKSNKDIINQIIDISQITTIKCYLFELSLKITLLTVLLILGIIIIA